MLRSILFAFLALLTTSCASRYSEFSHYSDEGRVKPKVALLPLVNSTSLSLDWDVADELTKGVYASLRKNGHLYLAPETEVHKKLRGMDKEDFTSPVFPHATEFAPSEFVVLLELIGHENLPYEKGKIKPVYPASGKISHVISMMVRVQVFDIRSEQPKMVLHEIVRSNHMIPTTIAHIEPQERSWGHDRYNFSPLGMAHARLERDLANRLTDYIQIARTH